MRGLAEEAGWADTLDWKTNDYDFHRLVQSLLDRLDSDYREKLGLRIDQLASRDEAVVLARAARSQYQEEEQRFQTLGIYVYLNVTLELQLGGRVREVLNRRSAENS